MKYISELIKEYRRNSDTCYVVGSGNSMSFYPKRFWNNKDIIGVNWMLYHLPIRINVSKHFADIPELQQSKGTILVMSEYDCGVVGAQKNECENAYIFTHISNAGVGEIDFVNCLGKNNLLVSHSTLTSAMHLACRLGYENIFVAGNDCGRINGKHNFDGYYKPRHLPDLPLMTSFNESFERQNMQVKVFLQNIYRVNIATIIPFSSLNYDGNTFER